MQPRSTIAKLKIIFVISLMIIALAAGSYYYLQSMPLLPKFQLTNLVVTPVDAGIDKPVKISVNVTNTEEKKSCNSVKLTINDAVKETKMVELSSGESKIVEFIVTESSEGIFFVEIGNLTGIFMVSAVPLPSAWVISDLVVSPQEVWVNEPVTISVNASNNGDEAGEYALNFRIDNLLRETKAVELLPGETTTVVYTIAAAGEGLHSVWVHLLTGAFRVVPTGMHTLSIVCICAECASSPSGVLFTLNDNGYTTPFSELLHVNRTYIISMPTTCGMDPKFPADLGIWQFQKWEDGSSSPTRTINLQGYMSVTAIYKHLHI